MKNSVKQHVTLIGLILSTAGISSHILDDVPLIDGHNDLAYNIYSLNLNNVTAFEFHKNLTEDPLWGIESCVECHTDLPRLRQGKVATQFWVAYVSCKIQYKDAVGKTLEQIDVIKRLIKKYPNDMQFVTTADGIEEAFAARKIGSLIGVEGGHSMDARLGVLRMYYELGVRYMTLTHKCNTPWSDSSTVDDASQPVHNLTEYGKLVVLEMNRIGMMVDLSHVSYNVMNQAIDVSRAPVIFSHSSAYSVAQNNRNVRDDTLLKLRDNNGVVMVTFYPYYINNNGSLASLEDVVDHIEHIVQIAGIDHVGIGSDFDGIEVAPKGLEDSSKYPKLFDRLVERNPTLWTSGNLAKLAGQNLIRVFRDVEMVSATLVDEEPFQDWISFNDLNAVEDENLWNCRTLLNNEGPKYKKNNM